MPEHRPSDPFAAAVTAFRLSILLVVGAGFAYLLAGSFGGGAQSGPWVYGYHLKGIPVSVQLGSSCETKAGISSAEGAATCPGVRWTAAGQRHTGHLVANSTDIQGHGTKSLIFTGQARALGNTAYGQPGPATTLSVLTTATLLTLGTIGLLTATVLRLRARRSTRPQPARRQPHPVRRPSRSQPARRPAPTGAATGVAQPAVVQHSHAQQALVDPAVAQPGWQEHTWQEHTWQDPSWQQEPVWQEPLQHELAWQQSAWQQAAPEPWEQPDRTATAEPHNEAVPPVWDQPEPTPSMPQPSAPAQPAPAQPTSSAPASGEPAPAGTTWRQPPWPQPVWSQPAPQP